MISALVLFVLAAAPGARPRWTTRPRAISRARAPSSRRTGCDQEQGPRGLPLLLPEGPGPRANGLRRNAVGLRVAGRGDRQGGLARHLRCPGTATRPCPPRPRLRDVQGAGFRGREGEPGNLRAPVPRNSRRLEDRRDQRVRGPSRDPAPTACLGGGRARGWPRWTRRARCGRADARRDDRLRRREGAMPRSPGASSQDVSGMWVTPGLVDAHVHFAQTGWADGRPDASTCAIATRTSRSRRGCAPTPSAFSAPTCARA